MVGTHIVLVPVKFAAPPRSREDVHKALHSLTGWNSLEPMVGATDQDLWELRLDVNAKSVPDAVKQGEQMHPFFFARLRRCDPKLAGDITAVLREEYLAETTRMTGKRILVVNAGNQHEAEGHANALRKPK